MAFEHILRISRSDSEGDYVLINVTSKGNNPLDLKLLATEGEVPYIAESESALLSSATLTDH